MTRTPNRAKGAEAKNAKLTPQQRKNISQAMLDAKREKKHLPFASANKRKSEGKTFAKMPKEPELKYFNGLIKTLTDTGQSAYSPKQWLQLFFAATKNY